VAAAGLRPTRRTWIGHLPAVLSLVAIVLLLVSAGRPHATVTVPKVAGTVILAFDVSNSMAADDVAPTRLAAAQAAAIDFAEAQPSTVEIGVVAFGQGGLTTHLPSDDRAGAIAAIKRLTVSGGTSVGQAILVALTTIVGSPVSLPDPEVDAPPPDLGYWGSATIVLLSDGEDTGGPDPVIAAELAASAGVRVETVGVGTVEGTTIEVDGFQVATALNEDLLTAVASATNGSYHRAEDAQALADVYRSLELRITAEAEFIEITAAGVAVALLLLTIGGFLMISRVGRIL
jgi:Ca-activated chloride channel family protein